MIKRITIRWIVVLALLQCTTAFAFGQQSGSIRGTVLDADFEAPLSGARVEVVEKGVTVESNAQGSYSVVDLAPGAYSVVVSKPGYTSEVRTNVLVVAGQGTDLDVSLAGDFTDMEEYVVEEIVRIGGADEVGLLNLRFEAPSLIDSLGADLLRRATVGSADEALGLISGATVADDATAVVRGLPDRYVSSQVNGVRLPSANEEKRAVELDQFPSAVIESVQVSKTFTPDQQGDASGGAVNIILKSIPREPIFSFSGQTSYNTQATNEKGFLGYRGGGVGAWGLEGDSRPIQPEGNWTGAVGVSPSDAPIDYKFSTAVGGSRELDSGVRVGGFVSLFYEKDSQHFDNGRDDSWWVNRAVAPTLTPQTDLGGVSADPFVTNLFDITESTRSIQWGGTASVGAEWDNHNVGATFFYAHTASDTATLAEDTRGKSFFFPGYDVNDPAGVGNVGEDAERAPWLRTATLEYNERTTGTFQLNGRHEFETRSWGAEDRMEFKNPILTWTFASSFANQDQPDKRLFGSLWRPPSFVEGNPDFITDPFFEQFKPAANFTLGNLQRTFRKIEEDSLQLQLNAELPFDQWSGDQGYFKVGYFDDRVDRTFDQESFSNFSEPTFITFDGGWDDFWSANWENEDHRISQELDVDVDYTGEFNIDAWYGMVDLPITSKFKLIGGARVENTEIITRLQPGANALYFPPDEDAARQFTPEVIDEIGQPFTQRDLLPALSAVYSVTPAWTVRLAYSQTVARPTFKERVPILQQEFLGGEVFIGNPNVVLAELANYDIRLDYRPTETSLVSLSYFYKDIKNAIERIQRNIDFGFTTVENYPTGRLSGFELELRQQLEPLWGGFEGLSVGANGTLIDSEVELPQVQIDDFENIGFPITKRDATNAPEFLYNLYTTYDIPNIGTQLGLFYTVRGDTLVTGDSIGQQSNYIPAIYRREFGTLNFSLAQRLSRHWTLRFQAKNLTNPTIEEVYRSQFTGPDLVNVSFTRGIEYALSIAANYSF